MKKFILLSGDLVIIMLIVCCFIPSALAQDFREFPPGLTWKQIETEHFIILYDEQNREIAQQAAAIAEPIHQRVTDLLNYPLSSKTYVILADHVDIINGYASPIPDNKIVLYLREPGAGMAPSFGIRSKDWLSLVFTHEYTHIVHMNMKKKWYAALGKIFGKTMLPNAGLPYWMIEGLAVYAETKFEDGRGYHPYYDMMMRTEILEQDFKKLDQMEALTLRTWPMGTICYLYGYFFFQYLADTYGEDRMIQLHHKNASKSPILGGNIFKKVYDKSESMLWKEWHAAMQQHYEKQLADIRSLAVTETTPISTNGYYTNTPILSPDGQYLYYIEYGAHKLPALIQYRLSDGSKTRLIEEYFSGNFSISSDGQKLYFSKNDVHHFFSYYSDLYLLDLTTHDVQRLTNGQRAFDPAIAPDDTTLVFTTTDSGSMNLMRMDLATKAITPILEPADHTQMRYPVFSSDGSKIALQMWKEGGFQDIYVMNSDGSNLYALTFDKATDEAPVWGKDDQYLFFSSDRTGVPNIFAYALQDQAFYQVTNVLTGAFHPAVTPDQMQLVFEHYSGNGMDIHLTGLNRDAWQAAAYSNEQPIEQQIAAAEQHESLSEENYSPVSSLLPKYWLPAWGQDEDGWQLGATLAGQDALSQHEYLLSALYGLESQRMSGYGVYVNRQFLSEITLFTSDSANLFTDIFRDDIGDDEDYWQREQVAGVNLSIPLYQRQNTGIYLSTGYRYKNLKILNDNDVLLPLPDEGALSGVSAGLTFGHLRSSLYAFSPEQGFLASVTYRRDDEVFGSDFNLHTAIGDTRVYLSLPKLKHHVLALRAVGGISDGDTLNQGVFQLGGPGISSAIAQLDQQRYFLRGYDANALAGNRFALGSVEYRFPLWYPQRGVRQIWSFFDSLTAAVFYDAGNAWEKDLEWDEFKHGAGAEARLNVVIKNALPVTFRLGYAHGFDDDLGESQFIYSFAINFWL